MDIAVLFCIVSVDIVHTDRVTICKPTQYMDEPEGVHLVEFL